MSSDSSGKPPTTTPTTTKTSSSRRSALLSLQERVANVYYTHGLFCSTHPVPVISFATIIILVCCYPFVRLPLPGNAPQEFITPARVRSAPSADVDDRHHQQQQIVPQWYRGAPVGYVQQVLVRSTVSPPSDYLEDAFRGPLMKAFDVLEIVHNYQHPIVDGNGTVFLLDDFCLHVAEPKSKRLTDHLPMYGCLCVSPANIWRLNAQNFLDDGDVVGTVLSLGRKGVTDFSTSLADVLFGVPWKETAIKKSSVENRRRRVLTYAITVVMSKYDAAFVQGLETRLLQSFPPIRLDEQQQQSALMSSGGGGNITHVYFYGDYGLFDFIPLVVTYVILFLYIYFSVRKIEMVKSKIGMAFSAVVTVLASLCMSVGLCTWFGLSFTIRAGQVYLKDIFPYLVVIVGLENILVLTKSVVSTPVNLDVKVRLAQGLSKEGWSITKNLVTELSVLTFGFFTFVPAIQEFCLFAVVGLLSDFFLQLVFFATILAVDIGRMEMSDLQRQSLSQGCRPSEEELAHMYPLFSWPLVSRWQRGEMKNSRSLSSMTENPTVYPAAPGYVDAAKDHLHHRLVKVPKRLRVAYFWARCRIFQRAFMMTFLVWVAFIIYKSGIVGLLTLDNSTVQFAASDYGGQSDGSPAISFPTGVVDASETPAAVPPSSTSSVRSASLGTLLDAVASSLATLVADSPNGGSSQETANVARALRHKEHDLWPHLLPDHWPTLFGYFNLSLNARYVSILPAIKLTISVGPEECIRARQAGTEPLSSANFQGESDSEWESDTEDDDYDPPLMVRIHRAYYMPSTTAERVLAVILAIPSVVFLVYVLMVLYHLICSKNYAEWRSSWSSEGDSSQASDVGRSGNDIFTQFVVEALPVVLEGHPQEVECLATDGTFVVSTCLAGEIRVWDSMSGECLNVIDRKRSLVRRRHGRTIKESEMDFPDGGGGGSDYESGSPPSRSDSFLGHAAAASARNAVNGDCESSTDSVSRKRCGAFRMQPNLASTINTDFETTTTSSSTRSPSSDGFDFDSRFRIYYDEHEQLMAEEEDGEQKDVTKTTRGLGSDDASPTTFGASHSPGCRTLFEEGGIVRDDENGSTAGLRSQSAVWCVDCSESVIVAGCSDGKIEFWNTFTGALKYVHEEISHTGVTAIRIYGHRVIAVRLNGSVDLLEVRSLAEDASASTSSSIYRRTNYLPEVDTAGGGDDGGSSSVTTFAHSEDELVCHWLHSTKAHQQPITVLEVEGGKAVTGSADHTLKVFRVEDAACLFTLHGHYGPITTLFIDKLSPMTAASGSQDGAVCLWDLPTGACVCRLRGHDGAITALSYTASYVLSAAADNKLLVWERFQGHLLNTINLAQNYCNSIIMLTDNLLLTGRQGSLGIWDIRLGDPVRIVRLGNTDDSVLVRQVRHVGHTIVCDYGSQLRVVRFPAIVEKVD